VIFRLDGSDSEYKTVYMYVLLVRQGFFSRLKNGIRYILGYRCRYGHFDEVVITRDNFRPLEEVVDFIKETHLDAG